MFRQIMIPLDGSAVAEGAIGYAERLVHPSMPQAEQRGSTIHLVRVVPPVSILVPCGIGTCAAMAQDDKEERLRAAEYLDSLRRRLGARGIQVRTALLTGSLVASLLEYQRRQGIDLVVLASYEPAGPGHLGHGSLLHPLLRRGPAPLFVIAPAIDPRCPQRALVPLDGSAGSELAFTLLGHLAPGLVGEVTLLRVVATEDEEFSAFRFLSSLRRRPELEQVGSLLRVECGDPAERIAGLGRDRLVVLTKPRHWLPSRWLSQSIADRVIGNGAAAVLIARRGTQTVRDDGSGDRVGGHRREPLVGHGA
jgi:nucleotide-binding universal stress UspA family protein